MQPLLEYINKSKKSDYHQHVTLKTTQSELRDILEQYMPVLNRNSKNDFSHIGKHDVCCMIVNANTYDLYWIFTGDKDKKPIYSVRYFSGTDTIARIKMYKFWDSHIGFSCCGEIDQDTDWKLNELNKFLDTLK